MKRTKRIGVPILLLGCGLLITGCSRFIHRTTGNVLSDHVVKNGIPSLMKSNIGTLAYSTSEADAALFETFTAVGSRTEKVSVALYLLAGFYWANQAYEHERYYLRAMYTGNAAVAQDERIAERNAWKEAALRWLLSYQYMQRGFGKIGETCPRLSTESDQLLFLFGLLGGVESLIASVSSMHQVNVPMDAAVNSARAANCLDNEKWWGLPKAIQGAIWTVVPGSAPKGGDGWQAMAQGVEIGNRSGMHLGYVLQATMADNANKTELVRSSLKGFVEARQKYPTPEKLRLMDSISESMMQIISDRIWLQATGHRTPVGGLGSFPKTGEEPQIDPSLEQLVP